MNATAAATAAGASPTLLGYEARYLGADAMQNPYPRGHGDHDQWRAGWFECDRELKGHE
jgi:hypothetical protein